VVRRVDGAGIISTVVGGGVSQGETADGGRATNAALWNPLSIAFDAYGNLYIADSHANLVRKVENGVITTVAGHSGPRTGNFGDGGRSATSQNVPFARA
jgi:hypothetical protein